MAPSLCRLAVDDHERAADAATGHRFPWRSSRHVADLADQYLDDVLEEEDSDGFSVVVDSYGGMGAVLFSCVRASSRAVVRGTTTGPLSAWPGPG